MDAVHDAQVSKTGCGYDPQLGTSWPCGVVISHGHDCANVFVISTKGASKLNRPHHHEIIRDDSNNRMAVEVQRLLNRAWRQTHNGARGQGQYQNRLRFNVKEHTRRYNTQEILERMGVQRANEIQTNPRLKKAIGPVLAQLPEGYRLVAFRSK